MAVHGTLTVFDSRKETWDSYSKRMIFYFIANEITDDDKKKAIFLSACDSRTFDLLRNLLQPAKPGEKRVVQSPLFAQAFCDHSAIQIQH